MNLINQSIVVNEKIFLKMIQNNRNSFIILTLICGIISFIGSILPYLNGKFIDYLTIGVTYKIILEMSLLILVLGLINVALYYVKQILIAKIKNEIVIFDKNANN